MQGKAHVGVALLTFVLFGCSTTANVELIGKDPAEGYFFETYSVKDVQAEVSILQESDFDAELGTYKESIVKDDSLSDSQRDELFKQLGKDYYADNLYLSLYISLKDPVPAHFDDFKFSVNDDSGQTMIEAIFPSARHVIGGYSGSTYQFFWLLKLTRPFTKGNFGSHDYKFTVTYPNGAIATYKLSPG